MSEKKRRSPNDLERAVEQFAGTENMGKRARNR